MPDRLVVVSPPVGVLVDLQTTSCCLICRQPGQLHSLDTLDVMDLRVVFAQSGYRRADAAAVLPLADEFWSFSIFV
jgi:hypothetical protein